MATCCLSNVTSKKKKKPVACHAMAKYLQTCNGTVEVAGRNATPGC